MFTKTICIATFFLCLVHPVVAKTIREVSPLSDFYGLGYDEMYRDEAVVRCSTAYCKALSRVSLAWRTMHFRDRPNTMARTYMPADFFEAANRKIIALLARRSEAAENCRVAQKIILQLALRYDDRLAFVELMEIIRLLPTGAERCRQAVIAAMPATEANAQLVHDADDFAAEDAESFPVVRRHLH